MPTETELKLVIEGAHPMRAATRRMRSCLQLFRPLIPKTVSSAINNGVRRTADALGPARELLAADDDMRAHPDFDPDWGSRT